MTAPDREDSRQPSIPPALAEALMALPDLPTPELDVALQPLREAWPDQAAFLDRYAANLRDLDEPSMDSALPGVIGPYHLVGLVGTGGMGTVYRAERDDTIRMTVAIKVIRAGLAGEGILRRFEYERRALAAMNHPAIARILDAGSLADGRPYYVMEFVEGEPLTQYCDRRRLGLAARLRLFQRICSGVQHAHQKGVIHRDLKPHNILIAQEGGEPAPKVLDFGLAKPTDSDLIGAEATASGLHGGTPAYMAPEQAAGDPGADSRADIYSLGVVLYELLTGVLPFSATMLRRAGTQEALKILQEVAPLRPSLRYSADSEEASIAAALRSSTARALLRNLRSDLDWIAMRALAKDPADRYQSATELSEDVQRFLDHAPVRAAPQGRLYRARKFVRQRRGLVVAGLLVLATAMLGGWATLSYAYRAEQQAERAANGEQRANRNAEEVRRQSDEIARGATRLQRALGEETSALRRAERREYETRIALAEAELAAGEAVLPRQHLEKAAHRLRGFEWYHLESRLDGSSRQLRGHDASLRSIAVSPDGRWFASSAHDNTVVFWDTATMQPMYRWPGHPSCPVPVVAHPDGDRVFVLRERHSVAAWSVSCRHLLWEHRFAPDPGIIPLACSPDGAFLAAGFTDGSIALLDCATGVELRRFRGSPVQCTTVAVSGDGRELLIGRLDGSTEVRRVVDGSLRLDLSSRESMIVNVAYCGGDERLVAISTKTITSWDRASGSILHERSADGPTFAALSVSADGTALATNESDGVLRIRDADSLEVSQVMVGHTERFMSGVAFTADGKGVLSGGNDRTIREWRRDDAQVPVLHGARGWHPGFATTSDGRVAECGGTQWSYRGEPAIMLWGPDLALRWRQRLDESLGVDFLLFDSSGARILGGTIGGDIVVFDAADGRMLSRWHAHAEASAGLALVPRSPEFASIARGTSVKFWVPTSPEGLDYRLTRTIEVGVQTTALGFSPDGRLMAVGCHENSPTFVYDLATAQRILTLEGNRGGVVSVAFDPTGTKLATASTDYVARLWSLADGRMIATMPHTDRVYSVAFSPDGTRLATGSWDSTVGIWDAGTGDRLVTLHGHRQRVTGVSFSGDGSCLYSNDELGQVHVWDTAADPGRRGEDPLLQDIAAMELRAREAAGAMAEEPCEPASLRRWQQQLWQPMQREFATVRRPYEAMPRYAIADLSVTPLPAPPTAEWHTPTSAAALIAYAWNLARPSVLHPTSSEAAAALACAREALWRIEQCGDRSAGRSSVLNTVAWALAASGEAQAALDLEFEILTQGPPQVWPAITEHIERLESTLATRRTAQRSPPRLGSGGASDEERNRMAAFAALADRLEDCARSTGAVIEGVLQRHETAMQAAPPDLESLWRRAAAAILAADDVVASAAYGVDGPVRIQPIDGLVPIGMNPRTKLWEFYDLASAADPTTVPTHDAEGRIQVLSGTGIVFVLVPGGKFTMGAETPAAVALEREAHLAPFLVACHELTQAQWQRLSAGECPSVYCAGLRFPGAANSSSDTCPVENVTFDRATEVLHWNGLDLPTEAQWEYVASRDDVDGAANVLDLDGLARMRAREREALHVHDGHATTAPVGSYQPNAFGLYDLRGNVAEWCADWLLSYSVPISTAAGRRGDPDREGASRAVRGGSWRGTAAECSPTARSGHDPREGTGWIGIRVVRNLP